MITIDRFSETEMPTPAPMLLVYRAEENLSIILTSAPLIPNAELQKQYGWKYADEADRINVAVFGMTAKEWRDSHPNSQKSENIRDYATKVQLLVLSNLQVLNADMITSGMDESSRSEKLNTVARDQLARFSKSEERLQRIESENKSDNQPFLN